MRVCMATTTFPRWAGDGQGPFLWGLAAGVRDLGVDVRIVTMHNPGSTRHMRSSRVWRCGGRATGGRSARRRCGAKAADCR